MTYLARTRPRVWGGPSLLTVIYLGVGLVVAATHHYFEHASTLKALVSATLAVILWPLLLLGINLHVH